MDGTLLYGLSLGMRSAALGSAAFLLIAAPHPVQPFARYVTMIAAGLTVLLVLVAMPWTSGWAGWIGALLGLAGAGAAAALTWRDGPAAPVVAAAAAAVLGGIMQGGAHSSALMVIATFLRESGAALWMGSLPLLWFALRGTGALRTARNHRWLALGGMALALPGVLIAAPAIGVLAGREPLLLATAVLLLGLIKVTLWQAWLLRGDVAPERLLPLTETAILLATALCAPIAALFLGVAPLGLWPLVPALAIAVVLLAGRAGFPLPMGALMLGLAFAGTFALGAGLALTGLLATVAGATGWYARRRAGEWDGDWADTYWPGLLLALILTALLLHGV
jgi:hypothetical protein